MGVRFQFVADKPHAFSSGHHHLLSLCTQRRAEPHASRLPGRLHQNSPCFVQHKVAIGSRRRSAFICRCTAQPRTDGSGESHQGAGNDSSDSGDSSGGGGDGNGHGPEHGSSGSSDGPKYPTWLRVWLTITALVYLVVRTKWRMDLAEKIRELEREEQLAARQQQEWQQFVQTYEKPK